MEALESAHRAYIGDEALWDVLGAHQFKVLTDSGLRRYHRVLDVGCGPLRLGRLLLVYLDAGNYYGMDPESWLIRCGREEVGEGLIEKMRPSFRYDADFDFKRFDAEFDFIVAHGILTHVTTAKLFAVLLNSSRCLAPEGKILATYLPWDTDNTKHEWSEGVVGFRRETVEDMAESSGLSIRHLEGESPEGHTWIELTHKEAPCSQP